MHAAAATDSQAFDPLQPRQLSPRRHDSAGSNQAPSASDKTHHTAGRKDRFPSRLAAT